VRTIRDLLGPAAGAAAATIDLPDESYNDGFEHYAESQGLTAAHVRGWRAAARAAVRALAADRTQREALLGVLPAAVADRRAFSDRFLTRFARRAFRHSVAAEDLAPYRALAEKLVDPADPYAGLLAAVEAILAAPDLLVIVEVGTPDPARPDVLRLRGSELATRLSFLVWGSPPDEALLDRAEQGALDTPSGLASEAARLLADPRAEEGRWALVRRWLRLHELDRVSLDAKAYPLWSAELRTSMLEETRRLVATLGGAERKLAELVTGSSSAINATLATLYKVPRPTATSGAAAWQVTDMRRHNRGAGVLTHAAILTASAGERTSTPIRRAVFVRESLICRPPPPPPGEVPTLDKVALPKTAPVAQILAAHRTNPSCAGCHQLLEPLGYGFERYGRIGEYREVDEGGVPLQGQGRLIELAPPDFQGPVELGARLGESTDLHACAVRQTVRFALGRHESPSEACTLDAIGAALRAGPSDFGALVAHVVQSEMFRLRRLPAGE
jgi:hypothetical protein